MKINLRVIIGVLLIAVVGYLAVTAVLPTSASGREVVVHSSSGNVTIENSSDSPVMAMMSARSTFRVTVSGDEPTELTSARSGSGRSVAQVIETELPPGPVVLTISRGSDVQFQFMSEANLEVTAVPRNAGDTQSLLLFAGFVTLALLFYISNATQHRWLRQLRAGKAAGGSAEPVSV